MSEPEQLPPMPADPSEAITVQPMPAGPSEAITVEPVPPARPAPEPELDTTSFSNGVRLSLRQWIGIGVFVLLLIASTPSIWKRVESFEPGADYRIPHDLGNDYWLYERWAGVAASQSDVLLIGDSVVWGEYVVPAETLSHYLNELSGKERFANLGLDGTHPLALSGLVEHYGGAVKGKRVFLQCNPLWMSSPRADLQDEKATEFNHPRLVPQFSPPIPSYKEENSTRLGVLVEQRVPFSSWANHIQQAYYNRTDIPAWTLEHPYENPLGPLTKPLPPSTDALRHLPQPWYKSGITKQDYPWVNMNTSLQWQAFRDVVSTLRQRGNTVFVLVGPFNEHLLEPASLARYRQVQGTITAWLGKNGIPHVAPPALPSELYGDASHPLAAGYKELARQLLNDSAFAPWK